MYRVGIDIGYFSFIKFTVKKGRGDGMQKAVIDGNSEIHLG